MKEFIPGKTRVPCMGRVYDEKEILALIKASLEFWLTAGPHAREFEEGLAKFIGVKYCSLTNSGSSANLLAVSTLTSPQLKDRRLKPGDKVITTACGFPTTLNPIIQNGLIPVFVDIELGTYNINEDLIEQAMSPGVKAIFIPHTLGNPVNLYSILEIAKRRKLWFLEDNCDSLGSKYKAKYTGSFGHISTCSFFPAHHITTGEGGAVFTDDKHLNRIVNSFRNWGRDCQCEPGHDNICGRRFSQQFGQLPFGYDHKYVYSHIGYNLKMTDLQAAIGVEQLKKLPDFIEKRKRNFDILYAGLKDLEFEYFRLPRPTYLSSPAWFGFPILCTSLGLDRNKAVGYLAGKNIATRTLFGGNLTKQPAYLDIKCEIPKPLTNTDLVMNNLFWIGVYPGLTKEMLSYMIEMIREGCRLGMPIV